MTKDNDEQEYISKSQRKRASHARQVLGEELVKLNAEQLDQFDLPDTLLEAVKAAQAIKQRGALKRQLQYIGKIMRELDPAPIQQQLDDLKGVSRQAVAYRHKIEQWRERLLGRDDSALKEFFDAYPEADHQRIRQLIRSAKKEITQNKPPRAYRELYQELKSLI